MLMNVRSMTMRVRTVVVRREIAGRLVVVIGRRVIAKRKVVKMPMRSLGFKRRGLLWMNR